MSWIRAARQAALELVERGVGLGVEEVLGDRLVEQVRVLGDDADRRPQRLAGELAHVVPVDEHRATGDVVEPWHERHERRLAGTGRADEGDRLAGFDGEGDVVEDVAVGIADRSALAASSDGMVTDAAGG